MAKIDLNVFVAQWANLKSLFNRNPNDSVFELFYEHLSKHLTTEEFVLAANKALTDNTHFPSAKELIAYAKGDPKQLAQKEWDAIVEAASRGQRPTISEAGQKALVAIGGRIAVETADTNYELPRLRKAFLESFSILHTEQPSPNGQPLLAAR
jgi:hypothetical protein